MFGGVTELQQSSCKDVLTSMRTADCVWQPKICFSEDNLCFSTNNLCDLKISVSLARVQNNVSRWLMVYITNSVRWAEITLSSPQVVLDVELIVFLQHELIVLPSWQTAGVVQPHAIWPQNHASSFPDTNNLFTGLNKLTKTSEAIVHCAQPLRVSTKHRKEARQWETRLMDPGFLIKLFWHLVNQNKNTPTR